MIGEVEAYISHHKLLHKQSKVIVGLSGGPDSMVLIHILLQLGYVCIASHCNFNLRGEDSNDDEKFVTKWCKQQNVTLDVVSFDTHAYALAHKVSIEMAARNLRYDWFEKLRKKYDANAIAIAHHRDDSIETILINLIRGTGIKGLTGIPIKNKYVVRPLLGVSRSEIMEYLASNQIPYVTDLTNEEDIYTRNTIRLKVLPLLETINPSVRNAILTTSTNLKEVEKIYDNYIHDTSQFVLQGNKINIEKLKLTSSPQSLLFEILSPLGFTPSVIEDVANNLDAIPGKVYLSNKYRLLKDRAYLIISDTDLFEDDDKEYLIYADTSNIEVPLSMSIKREIKDSNFKIQKINTTLQVDFDKLTFPLTLRRWRKGDWFIPFGMTGKKKLSDFFSDNKFNLLDKETTWILTSGDEIVWIVNHRLDDRFKITNDTKTIFIVNSFK